MSILKSYQANLNFKGRDKMQNFVKVTKLTNINGRADYISSPERQEKILASSPAVDFKPYAEYERTHQRSDTPNNEGREIIIALPNQWSELPIEELSDYAQKLAESAIGKSTDMQWAVHWNKLHTNLHMHCVFSERKKRKNSKVYDRDIYLDNDGKTARTRAARATDAQGNILPPVHRKGELQGDFTAKNKRYTERSWVEDTKKVIEDTFIQLGVKIQAPETFHQYHEGKGSEALIIKKKNQAVKIVNQQLIWAGSKVDIDEEIIKKLKQQVIPIIKEGQVPVFCIKQNTVEVFSRTWDDFLNSVFIKCNEKKAMYLAAELKKEKISYQLLPEGIKIQKKIAESKLFKKIENEYRPSLINAIKKGKQKSASTDAVNSLDYKKSKNRNEPHR